MLNQSGFKNYTIVRPVIVYAENCLLLVTWKGRVIPYRAKQKGKLLLPIEAKEKHAAIIYAGDIARLFAELLFNEKSFGETYTLGSPETITWGGMAKTYEELCGITSEWIPGEEFGKMATGNTQEIPDGMKFMLYYDRFNNRAVNVEKVFKDTKIKAEQFISHKEGLKSGKTFGFSGFKPEKPINAAAHDAAGGHGRAFFAPPEVFPGGEAPSAQGAREGG